MYLLALVVRVIFEATLAPVTCDSDLGLELASRPSASIVSGQANVQLRWKTIPNLWELKPVEIVNVGLSGTGAKSIPHELKMPKDFRDKKQSSLTVKVDLPRNAKVGDIVCIQFGAMRVISVVVP